MQTPAGVKTLDLGNDLGLVAVKGCESARQANASLKLHSTHSKEEFVIDPATTLCLL